MEKQTRVEHARLNLSFSLLWPAGRQADVSSLPAASSADLETDKLIRFFAYDDKNYQFTAGIFGQLCRDPATITYRLDLLDDLLGNPRLATCLTELIPVIDTLRYYVFRKQGDDEPNALAEVVRRLRELEHYVLCVQKLAAVFTETGGQLCARGWQQLEQLIREITAQPVYSSLVKLLPELLARINNLRSITIGINLTGGLVPYEAALVEINSERYTDAPLYRRVFGSGQFHGLAELHKVPGDSGYTDPLMVPFFQDLAKLLKKTVEPLAKDLKQFVSINGKLFVKLQAEFQFYAGALQAIRSLQSRGLPMVRPVILNQGERQLSARGLYNINLAIHLKQQHRQQPAAAALPVVPNDCHLDDAGRILILTGPNRGGKTTFLQAVGLAQLLMQVGLYVPASQGAFSPVDNLYTHYPVREEPAKGTGRFGEEAQRLRTIFNTATGNSLILLNESFSSTSVGEGVCLAQDVLRVLRILGARVLFATHLHELAAGVERINADTPGTSKLVSLVALVRLDVPGAAGNTGPGVLQANSAAELPGKVRPTFRIVPGPPMGQSYAAELAASFGVDKAQLLAGLQKRGVIPE